MSIFEFEDGAGKVLWCCDAPPESAAARFNREIETIQWDEIVFAADGKKQVVELPQPAHDARLAQVNAAIRDAMSFRDLPERLG